MPWDWDPNCEQKNVDSEDGEEQNEIDVIARLGASRFITCLFALVEMCGYAWHSALIKKIVLALEKCFDI